MSPKAPRQPVTQTRAVDRAVSVAGHGPPVLLLAGIGGNRQMWAPFREQLTGLTTITFDMPGTGDSTAPLRPRSMRNLASLAMSAVRLAGFERVAVLGYSFGGAVAQQLAIQHPRVVSRLVLAATNTGVLSLPTSPDRLLHMLTPVRYRSATYYEKVAPHLFGGRQARDRRTRAAEFGLRSARPPSHLGYMAQLAAIGAWTSLPLLPLISQPTLVVAGDDDPVVPLLNARVLARGIPDARLVVLPGSGHLFLLDEPERAASVIAPFLAAGDLHDE